eukprot:symbB.v1.2.014516.t1/scaffold1064.1/size140376/2
MKGKPLGFQGWLAMESKNEGEHVTTSSVAKSAAVVSLTSGVVGAFPGAGPTRTGSKGSSSGSTASAASLSRRPSVVEMTPSTSHFFGSVRKSSSSRPYNTCSQCLSDAQTTDVRTDSSCRHPCFNWIGIAHP